MIHQTDFIWPEGKPGAVTSSWDDGSIHDPRLVEVFRSHGLRGTFHMSSGLLRGADRDDPFFLHESEVASVYAGQEIAAHSLTHPNLWTLSDDLVMYQLVEDRRRLERISGYPVTGFAFPNGKGGDDERLEGLARRAGLRTARASGIDGHFAPPTNWLRWGVACHFSGFEEAWSKFEAITRRDKLFFWWGHSHEFEFKYGWELLEKIAKRLQNAPVWHATNQEVYDYVQAWRGLNWTIDLHAVHNPSCKDVWLMRNKKMLEIKSGSMVCL